MKAVKIVNATDQTQIKTTSYNRKEEAAREVVLERSTTIIVKFTMHSVTHTHQYRQVGGNGDEGSRVQYTWHSMSVLLVMVHGRVKIFL